MTETGAGWSGPLFFSSTLILSSAILMSGLSAVCGLSFSLDLGTTCCLARGSRTYYPDADLLVGQDNVKSFAGLVQSGQVSSLAKREPDSVSRGDPGGPAMMFFVMRA
jgi:hypothetical protein